MILPRIIPREEIEHLLNHMYGCLQQASETVYKYCLRDVAVIELFFATGARVYEISNIRAENVNLNTGLNSWEKERKKDMFRLAVPQC